MKELSYYGNAGEYPEKPTKPRATSNWPTTSQESKEFTEQLEHYEKELPLYQEKKDAYDKRNNELYAEFKADLIESQGLTGHPKAELLFSKAWDHGHASGFGDVVYYFNDLADLLA